MQHTLSPAILLVCVSLSSAAAQDARKGHGLRLHRAPVRTDTLPLKYVGPPTVAAITPGDIMTRLYKFADDSMMGRLAGTPWSDKGTDYIAAELSRLGLEPAGENGTYFQHPLELSELVTGEVTVGEHSYTAWRDFAPRDQGQGARTFDGAQAVFGGTFGDTASYLPAAEAAGKVVVIRLPETATGHADYLGVNRSQLTTTFRDAAAIAVADIDYTPPGFIENAYKTPALREKGTASTSVLPTYFYVTTALASDMLGTDLHVASTGQMGRVVHGTVRFGAHDAPGRNVVAILRGSDPRLTGQYVAIGAHNDHIGFSTNPVEHDSIKAMMPIAAPEGADSPEPATSVLGSATVRHAIDSLRALHPSRPDSIFNGADDDGSGTTSVLEIAEAFAHAKTKPKRSLLFVFHVGEEEGMLGSNYFTEHPTVPRDSIVAQLNIDMIGRGGATDVTGQTRDGKLIRGGPGYLQLIGSRRLSAELGDIVEKTNVQQKLGFRFDYSLDADGHPQNIYCRSDHYSYARWGIPIVFFTTGGHADYHQVTDEAQYIDYNRAALTARLVYDVAVAVGNLDHRVLVDKPKPDPHGSCKQ